MIVSRCCNDNVKAIESEGDAFYTCNTCGLPCNARFSLELPEGMDYAEV